MSFLAPLFLLGGLAVALPVLFHLIRRSAREKTSFSSLMFLSPMPPRVNRRSRLENILLLLLRCLVLGLLALGFARPFIQNRAIANAGADSTKQVILLIDQSASMRRDNLWNQAVTKAEQILQSLSPADRAAVLGFDRQVHQVLPFTEWAGMNVSDRVPLTMQRLKQLSPSWAGTHIGKALLAATESFGENSPDPLPGPREIVLITDLQEGSRLEGLQGFEWPKNIQIILEPVRSGRPTNAGLQPVPETEHTTGATNAGPRIRITNAASSEREQFQIRWTSAPESSLEIYVPPGQSRIVPAPPLPAGKTADTLVLTGDDHPFDNQLHYLQPVPEETHVLYLGPEQKSDPAAPLYYLERAFQQTKRQAVHITATNSTRALPPQELEKFRMLVAAGPLGEDQAALAQQFIQSGKTVLFLLTTADAAHSLRRILPGRQIGVEEANPARYAMFAEINFEHPLFAPFADPRYSDFTKIHFWKYRRVQLDSSPDSMVLARFDTGDPALLQISEPKGQLLILTSGWHPADSQLALSSKFVPLLYSILELSGGAARPKSQYAVADEISVAFLHSKTGHAIRKPDGSTVQLERQTYFQPDQPGIYEVTSTQPPVRFAVNVDAAETKTPPLPRDELERFGLPLQTPLTPEAQAKTEQQQRRRLASELESQQRLWRWLIAAALAFVVLETWIAARASFARAPVAQTSAST